MHLVLIRLLSHCHMLTLYRKQLWVSFCPRRAFQFIHLWNSIKLRVLSLKSVRHISLCRQQTVRNPTRVWSRAIKHVWDCVNVLNDAPVGLYAGNGWIFGVNVTCIAGDLGLVNEQLDGWSSRAWCWRRCHTHYLTHSSPVGTKHEVKLH